LSRKSYSFPRLVSVLTPPPSPTPPPISIPFECEKLISYFLVVAVVVGILAGPLVADGINPYSWNDTDEITKQFTRCVIAIQVSETIFFICLFVWCINRLDGWLLMAGHGFWNRITKVRNANLSFVSAGCTEP
jgi:hypothetical protein